jgi:hypothetical protein
MTPLTGPDSQIGYRPGYNCGEEVAFEEQPMSPDRANRPDPIPRETIPAEILEWARQTFDEDEFLAHVREIEATGGVRLEDFISELEATVNRK